MINATCGTGGHPGHLPTELEAGDPGLGEGMPAWSAAPSPGLPLQRAERCGFDLGRRRAPVTRSRHDGQLSVLAVAPR